MGHISFSATCKKFYSLTRSNKKIKQLLCFLKWMLNFDDYYAEFLQSQFQWLNEEIWTKLNEKFKEDTVVFSLVKQKLKNLPNLLLPHRIYCHCFYCVRGNFLVGSCNICKRIFIDDIDNSKKLDKKFIITKNSVDHLPVRSLMEKVNTKCVALNIYFMVGVNTISSGNVFFEIANNYFSVYIYLAQIYLRTFFNLLILVSELVSDTYLSEQAEGKNLLELKKNLLKRFYFLITVNVVKNF